MFGWTPTTPVTNPGAKTLIQTLYQAVGNRIKQVNEYIYNQSYERILAMHGKIHALTFSTPAGAFISFCKRTMA